MKIDSNGHSADCNTACRAYDMAIDEYGDESHEEVVRCRTLKRQAEESCPACRTDQPVIW